MFTQSSGSLRRNLAGSDSVDMSIGRVFARWRHVLGTVILVVITRRLRPCRRWLIPWTKCEVSRVTLIIDFASRDCVNHDDSPNTHPSLKWLTGFPNKMTRSHPKDCIMVAGELCLYYGHLTWREPQVSWAISLTELKFWVFKAINFGVLLAGNDIITCSDPWCTRMDGCSE